MNARDLTSRVLTIQEIKGYKENNAEFARELGISYTTYASFVGNKSVPSTALLNKILLRYPDISCEWLMRGEGEMFISDRKCDCDRCLKPLITIDVSRQPNLDVKRAYDQGVLELPKTPVVIQFGEYSCGWVVPNGAMSPDFQVGDKLALQAQSTPHIINGNAYVLDTTRGMFLRYVYESDNDDFLCKSLDARFTEMVIPKSEIYQIFVVMGMLRNFF